MVSFGEPLKHVITVRGPNLVCRTDDGFFLFSFCFIFFFFAVCAVLERGEGGRVHVQNARVCRHHATHVETHVRVVPVHTATF